jgi:acetyl-CoA C-acetyltransferase
MTNSVCVLGAGVYKIWQFNESIIEIALNARQRSHRLCRGITPKEIQAGYISNVFGVADKQAYIWHLF